MQADLETFCSRALGEFPELTLPFSRVDDVDPELLITKLESFADVTHAALQDGSLSRVRAHVAFVAAAMGEADDDLYRALFVGYVAELFSKLQANERDILIEVAPEIEPFVVGLWPDDQASSTNCSSVGSTDCACPLLAVSGHSLARE